LSLQALSCLLRVLFVYVVTDISAPESMGDFGRGADAIERV